MMADYRNDWHDEMWRRKREMREAMREYRNASRQARRGHWQGHHAGGGGVFIGIVLAGVGALFLLRNLGLLYIDDLWQYWPVILIVLGLSRVLSSFSFGSRFGGGLLLVVGSIFLLHNLDIIHGNIWGFFWPVLLIAIGAGLLFRHLNGPPHDWRWSGAVASSSSTGGDTLHAVAVFHGVEQSIDSQDFQGGEATAVFGGVEVDLRKAATTREEVRIEANAVFGGVDIRVPENWSVTVRGDGVFGGYDNKTINPSAKEPAKHPRLVITGGAVFGGVTVRN